MRLISMVARSMTRSNVRPDILKQDPYPTIDENLFKRAAGPYQIPLASMSAEGQFRPRRRTLPRAHVRFAPKSDLFKA